MGDELKGKVTHESKAGIFAEHPGLDRRELIIAASTSSKDTKNTAKLQSRIVACWKMEDICFDFDKAFVRGDQDTKDEFKQFAAKYQELVNRYKVHPDYTNNPNPPVTIFGHADPIGEDTYNKTLSERRAKAVYGVLTRDPNEWKAVFKSPEDIKQLQDQLQKLGHSCPVTGSIDTPTEQAIKEHMRDICPDLSLEKKDFLGRGECAFQGCSEFNPVLVFSKSESDAFKKDPDKRRRNTENQPNRRVVAFLFEPGTGIKKNDWPCPQAPDIQGCRDRFYKGSMDGDRRRNFQTKRREYQVTKDTFACRFYDRIANISPCEAVRKTPQIVRLGFDGDIPYSSPCEEYEINNGGKVMAYRAEELEDTLSEIQYKLLKKIWKTPEEKAEVERLGVMDLEEYKREMRSQVTAVVQFAYSEGKGGKPPYKVIAQVVDLKTNTVLFEHAIEAQKKIDVNGLWYLSSHPRQKNRQVWRMVKKGSKPPAGRKTKWITAPEGLTAKRDELCKALRGTCRTITDRVEMRLYGNPCKPPP